MNIRASLENTVTRREKNAYNLGCTLQMEPRYLEKGDILPEASAETESTTTPVAEAVYGELRRLTASYFRRERPNHTLQPTALVNEVYLQLLGNKDQNWKDRAQFFSIAACAMRHILIDHARLHLAKKRGGPRANVQLDEALKPAGHALDNALTVSPEKFEELIQLHDALNRLALIDSRQARVVELRFFGGLTEEETAEVLGVTKRTVTRYWSTAKLWLARELRGV